MSLFPTDFPVKKKMTPTAHLVKKKLLNGDFKRKKNADSVNKCDTLVARAELLHIPTLYTFEHLSFSVAE